MEISRAIGRFVPVSQKQRRLDDDDRVGLETKVIGDLPLLDNLRYSLGHGCHTVAFRKYSLLASFCDEYPAR